MGNYIFLDRESDKDFNLFTKVLPANFQETPLPVYQSWGNLPTVVADELTLCL